LSQIYEPTPEIKHRGMVQVEDIKIAIFSIFGLSFQTILCFIILAEVPFREVASKSGEARSCFCIIKGCNADPKNVNKNERFASIFLKN
jgi:hypothetical protein